jgi:hypothetical protein
MPSPRKPHLGALQSRSSCSTCERVVILRPCVRIPHDPRKGWPGRQDWQPSLYVETWGAVGVGQRSHHAHHVEQNAELHVATDVTVRRVNEPTPPSKVHQMTPGQSAEDAPDRPRTQRDAALHPPASPRAESRAMTGGQRERAVGGHTRSRCHPLPPNVAQGRLRESLRTSRAKSQTSAL